MCVWERKRDNAIIKQTLFSSSSTSLLTKFVILYVDLWKPHTLEFLLCKPVRMAFVPMFSYRRVLVRPALSIWALCKVFLVFRDSDLTDKWLKWLLLRSAQRDTQQCGGPGRDKHRNTEQKRKTWENRIAWRRRIGYWIWCESVPNTYRIDAN